MRDFVASAVAAVGALLTVTGAWWLWTGFDIVQVERGWATVIAGATALSAGLILVALAAVLARLGNLVRALEEGRPTASPLAVPPAPAPPPTRPPLAPETTTATSGKAPAGSAVVDRHVAGDTTYVMFADGSVEAQTPEGVVTFESVEALRAYAEAREAGGSDVRSGASASS